MTDSTQRPSLRVKSAAAMAEWLRTETGTGPLAGLFRRTKTGRIVHCLRVDEAGYVEPKSEDDDNGPAQIQDVEASTMASRVQYTYDCFRMEQQEDGGHRKVPAMFPKDAARVAVDCPDKLPNLRPLRGVVHTPIIRRDGSILDTPGYDKATRLLYLPDSGLTVPTVPDDPDPEDIAGSLALLRHMVSDFQFLTPHDEANFLGMLLTPLLRELAPPAYKLFAISAPQPGSGKSLLAQVARILHGGVFRSEMPEDGAELRKAITSVLTDTTAPVVQIDNVTGVFRSSIMAGLLTSPEWSDRILGVQRNVHCDNDRLWLITGNNVTLGGDLVRRTVWVTIDPGTPNPHLRDASQFQIPHLDRWVTEHRGELLGALLTLVRSWVSAGRPVEERGSDSYATWIQTIDGILTMADVPGIFDHKDSARQSVGADDDDWRDFLDAVFTTFRDQSWTVRALLDKVDDGKHGFGLVHETTEQRMARTGWTIALDALPAGLADKAAKSPLGPRAVAKSLGKWLDNREGRWAGEYTVRKGEKGKSGTEWRIELLEHVRNRSIA